MLSACVIDSIHETDATQNILVLAKSAMEIEKSTEKMFFFSDVMLLPNFERIIHRSPNTILVKNIVLVEHYGSYLFFLYYIKFFGKNI